MDRLARRVAARWAFEVVRGSSPPTIPAWVFQWGDRHASTLSLDTQQMPVRRPDADVFQDAKESVNILLPNVQGQLWKKFQEKYEANASQTGTRLYYFFESKFALETVSISLVVKRGVVFLAFAVIPHSVTTGRPDYSKVIEEQVRVSDPEMAGLALMRLVRKVLSRV